MKKIRWLYLSVKFYFQGDDWKTAMELAAVIKKRCHNRNSEAYERYGGRGISVCPEWFDDFSTFFCDMGFCPPGLSIDRVNNDGNYEPGNCRWATSKEQANNRHEKGYLGGVV